MSTLRLPDGRFVRGVSDSRSGLVVWSRDGEKASRAALASALEGATDRAMPPHIAEKLGNKDRSRRFAWPMRVKGKQR